MSKTLGLDLGSNSLGWAILDDITGDVLDKGVVVFPEGIDAASDTLETPAAIRRNARMGRRMKFRRKMRKWMLLRVLIANGMCPMTEEELLDWQRNDKYPVNNKDFIEWLKSTDKTNPYADRAAAAKGKVGPLVLGRALYHIAQRRGFKSSRKDAGEDGESDTKGAVKGDIAALTREIADAGCRTLGQYFAKRIEDEKGAVAKTRIRKRYTGRIEHYMVEFSVIMMTQGIAHDSELYKKLYNAIFMQRPLRSQKHLVGNCPLEPHNPRAQIGHPAFEEYRMLAFVNNLSFENARGEKVSLTAADRELACSAFMKASTTMKFGDIAKLFKKRFKVEGLKFHYYRDDENIATCSTRHKIRSAFGDVEYDEQMVFDALTFFDDDERLSNWFAKHYPSLTVDAIGKLVKIHPKEGNANYSLKAINRILPFLRKGHDLFTARLLAKLPDVVKKFAEREDEIVLHLREIAIKCQRLRDERTQSKLKNAEPAPRLLDMFHDYLINEIGIEEGDWQKLYLRGDSAYSVDPKRPDRIPAVALGMIRNPLVQRSMTTLRRLVNFLRDHGKIDGDTTIRIELARGVNDFATRHAIQLWQKDREAMRENARKELGANASEEAIDRYLLWEEQGHQCLYTGNSISLAEVIAGNAYDIEHTVPRSKSGDDSLANKTLCESRYNRDVKKGMVPAECPNYDEITVRLRPWFEKREELEKVFRSRQRAAHGASDPQLKANARIKAIRTKLELDYWRDKIRRFEISPDKLEDPAEGLSGFKRRQLVDTGIMCSHAVELLRSVYPRVYSVNGAATAFARKAWGIQGDEQKDRSEHTHHAKDAMVIAALTPGRFNAICSALKDDGRSVGLRPCDVCPPPYPDFAEKVRKAVAEILVKHVLRQTTLRQSSKQNALAKSHPQNGDPAKIVKYVKSQGDTVRGQLHKDTFYGCIACPDDGKKAYVVRKSLIGPVAAAESLVDKIVDPAISAIVADALAKLKKDGIKNVEPGAIKMPSGVPVNKVRIYANTTNPARLRNHAMASDKDYKTPYYVVAGFNFRLGIFSCNGKLSYETESGLAWAKGHKKDRFVPLSQKPGFIGYVQNGAMAIAYNGETKSDLESMGKDSLSKRLYYVRVLPSENDSHAELQYHKEARMKKCISEKSSTVDVNLPTPLIRTSAGRFLGSFLFENIHFRIMLDGAIKFL